MANYPADETDVPTAGQTRAQQATARARRRAWQGQLYQSANELFTFHGRDLLAFLQHGVRWIGLGSLAGSLAGAASWIFLTSLAWATATRLANPMLLYALPLAGLTMGWLYYRFGGAAALGNNLVIDEVNSNRARIPLRMAPLVLLGTIVTHLCGGSAGREGTAIQMGASLADGLRRLLGLTGEDRRLLLMAGIAGGFGSVFGVPAAGFVFGMEVQGIGRIRYEGIIPCLVASFVGDWMARALGTPHAHYPQLPATPIDLLLLAKIVLAGIAFGLTSLLFVELTHGIKLLVSRTTTWTPLYPVIGGFTVIGLTWLVGTRDYLGLSLPLIADSVEGAGVAPWAFALKLLFTAVTLGTGYLGGEVTPLFVIGSTLGAALSGVLGVPAELLAAIGLVAVFAGASNTPLACAIMGIELFGGGATPYLFLGCVVAYLTSGHRGIYVTQRVHQPKTAIADLQPDDSLRSLRARRGGWLPPLPALTHRLETQPVRTLMTTPAVSVNENATLSALISCALREGVRAVPVVNAAGQVVGMISDNDLLRYGLEYNLHQISQLAAAARGPLLAAAEQRLVGTLMSSPVATIADDAPVERALILMREGHWKRLPVVDRQDRLVGMLTRSDILRALAFQSPQAGTADFFDWAATVGDVELEEAVTVSPATPLTVLLPRLQRALQLRAVVIDANGAPLGMISESDLLRGVDGAQRAVLVAALHGQTIPPDLTLPQTAADLMSAPVVSVDTDTKISDAVRLLIDHRIKRLPVVDEAGRVVGLASRRALLYGMVRGG
jgi:H+/Cl- antiporter ClcA/CBS domain-containing protein